MHNNYYLIQQLVPELKILLVDSVLTDCFSQNKNEVIFRFNKTGVDRIIIGHLNPQFTCLSFPEEYAKARKNTATIFKSAINKVVTDVLSFENERALLITLKNQTSILFKLFGHQANVVLYKENIAKELFRGNLKRDFECNISDLDKSLDQSKQSILEDLPELKKVYPTLDKRTRSILLNKIAGLPEKEAYGLVKSFINKLKHPTDFSIIKEKKILKFTLLSAHYPIAQFKSPTRALTEFYKLSLAYNSLEYSKRNLLRAFTLQTTKTKVYIKKSKAKLDELKNRISYKETADILMANLHLIKTNSSSIELLNFYTGEPVRIKLNPRLNPQQNAEKYYQKGKNVSIEINKLDEAIDTKEHQLATLQSNIAEVESSTSMSELKKFIKSKKTITSGQILPYKKFVIDGFTVLVGKNAKQNDILTLKIAKKNDLFFHAKDVSGSHTILKYQSGKNIPKAVLEQTAALAAYYSKRKTDSLCPVGYTQKKYVRKLKGSPPGLVIVEREKVILVEPKLLD